MSLEPPINQVANQGRNSQPLTPQQISLIKAYALELGIPENSLKFTKFNTAYGNIFGMEIVQIGSDVAPLNNPPISGITANSRISIKGSLAHEWIGHRGARIAGRNFNIGTPGTGQINYHNHALEEAQASIRAAKLAPSLTHLERYTLLRDGIARLKSKGLKIRQVRHLLYINQL